MKKIIYATLIGVAVNVLCRLAQEFTSHDLDYMRGVLTAASIISVMIYFDAPQTNDHE